jgi:hypothetical protein
MQEGLVIITILIACLYLGKKAYTWFHPKNEKCDGCSFGQASQNKP